MHPTKYKMLIFTGAATGAGATAGASVGITSPLGLAIFSSAAGTTFSSIMRGGIRVPSLSLPSGMPLVWVNMLSPIFAKNIKAIGTFQRFNVVRNRGDKSSLDLLHAIPII